MTRFAPTSTTQTPWGRRADNKQAVCYISASSVMSQAAEALHLFGRGYEEQGSEAEAIYVDGVK